MSTLDLQALHPLTSIATCMNTQVDDDAKLFSVSTPACSGLDIKFKIRRDGVCGWRQILTHTQTHTQTHACQWVLTSLTTYPQFKRTSNRKRAQKNKKGALRGTCTGVNEQGQKRENKKTR
jgi:hypothetical protein